ncbi:carotenoid 9,10(9',10')-cleavage dioxygenase-like [Triticum dicoccoides]|uniref:carotenoid 9,10(9',10')-cleavage dioxygenase-like n=1 Tax=Triticum dicoccoides TaxID=85692 RepID=UPI000E7A9E91|nr:carotenoid 9,10(9',10')-cleavage dioxygenase-like [Triticum dicoccoides]
MGEAVAAAEDTLKKGAVLVPAPQPSKGVASWAVDLLERLAVRLGHDKAKPLHWLSGNFAPVRDETPPAAGLPVRGHLPECLNGEFVRVGPNPKFVPVAGYHWFDGDGMIHAMRIKDGKATYVSRYVKTSRLKQEEYFGGAKFMKIGDLKGFFGLFMVQMQALRKKLKILDVTYGFGTANTALIYHHGKLLALSEADKPYVVKVLEDGDLQTLGLLDYDKRLKHSFTAHPKVDPFTDEMFTFGYSHEPPYCTYRVITKDGVMLDPVPITIPESVMMHDFAITENYSIFMDLPLLFRPKEMVKNGEFIYKFDPTKKGRFGILQRYEKDEKTIRWFELPNCFIFHNANAWEEGDEVVLITCRLENPDLDKVNGTQNEKLENFGNELYEMRFNMKTGAASQKQLSVAAVDFPRINESYTGRKQRYVYCTILDSIAKVTGVIKFDLHAEPESVKKQLEVGGNVMGIYDLGPGRFGSEAVFVPKEPGVSGEEDDGYLILFVHDENTGKSEVNVIDAKTMSPDPVAVVELPNRVPYGFHAFFVNEEQLVHQQAEV